MADAVVILAAFGAGTVLGFVMGFGLFFFIANFPGDM